MNSDLSKQVCFVCVCLFFPLLSQISRAGWTFSVMHNQAGNLFLVRPLRCNPLQGLWCVLHVASKCLSENSMDALTLLLCIALWKVFFHKNGF